MGMSVQVKTESGLNPGLSTTWLCIIRPDNLPELWFLHLFNGHSDNQPIGGVSCERDVKHLVSARYKPSAPLVSTASGLIVRTLGSAGMLALPLICCVTLEKSLNLSELLKREQ